jgi:hypothetical protein
LGTTITNENLIQEEIERRLNSGNTCYRSVQNLLSSRLLSKNVKVRIYKTIILLVVLYGCGTWSLTLREERRVRVSENRVLRIFRPKRDEETGSWTLQSDEVCLWSVNQRATEAEESPLLRFVTRKHLVKTRHRKIIKALTT